MVNTRRSHTGATAPPPTIPEEQEPAEMNPEYYAATATTTATSTGSGKKGSDAGVDRRQSRSASITSASGSGRIRINPLAVSAFEYVYAIEKKPNEALIRVLGQAFGESFPRVKVWFQNRRGRDTRDKTEGGSTGANPIRRPPQQLPPAVLQTLLNQQRQQNPEVAQELLELMHSTGSNDVASTTAQALNAMLAVNSLSKFWGHHNHLLSNEVLTRDGGRYNLFELQEDPSVQASPLMAALLERVIEVRQGVIDQFLMTDNLIREALPLDTGVLTPSASSPMPVEMKDPMLQPPAAAFGAAVSNLPEQPQMNWEAFGYGQHPFSFAYGGEDQQLFYGGNAPTWEFINEDFSTITSDSVAIPTGQSGQAGVASSAPTPCTGKSELEMMMFIEDVDPRVIPIKMWILENLVKAIQSHGVGSDLQEAIASAQFSPADFHRLCSFINLHEEQRTDLLVGGPVKFRVAQTLQGFAGWILSGADFIRILPEPLDDIFEGLSVRDARTGKEGTAIELASVCIIFDLNQHLITLKALYTAFDEGSLRASI